MVLFESPCRASCGLMRKSITLRGIYVGPRAMFAEMNAAIATHDLRPVIDSRYPLLELAEAFRHQEAQRHFGKICIEL